MGFQVAAIKVKKEILIKFKSVNILETYLLMIHQKPGRRGRNCEFLLKKERLVKSFETMGGVARLLNVCITSVLNAIDKKRKLKGFLIECIEKKPNYVRQYNMNGKEISKFETISNAAKSLKKLRKGKTSSLESGISLAARTGVSRFGYWWRRDGTKIISEEKPEINKDRKVCSYMKYSEESDRYEKCGRIFISQGNYNHYCSVCNDYINLNAENFSLKSSYKISQPNED